MIWYVNDRKIHVQLRYELDATFPSYQKKTGKNTVGYPAQPM
jgi:hypothetical protein